MIETAIKVENLNKSFDVASGKVHVLKNISFEIKSGEFVIIFGPSGCGKSTLLHTILGLEKPDTGIVKIFNNDMYVDKTGESAANLRMKEVGMVYQQAYWVKSINVVENTALPLRLLGIEKEKRLLKAHEMLKSVKLHDWAKYHPSELSSGQQQMVSLSRALITDPKLIIADEPTGNLDYETGGKLIQMLKEINKTGKTVVMVTHDLEYLGYADRCIKLLNGEIQKIFSPMNDSEEMKKVNIKKDLYERISKEK
jgi:putative ABC transport system ATP-binding protein